MEEMLKDPITFYAIAFIIFVSAAIAKGKKPLLGWLDSEIAKIRDELDAARKLRAEAEDVLRIYQQKQVEALKEAEQIIKHAEEEAVRLRQEAEVAAKAALARSEAQIAERIRLSEQEAIAAVREAVIDEAMRLARDTIAKSVEGGKASALIDQGIEAVGSTAKAAQAAKAA